MCGGPMSCVVIVLCACLVYSLAQQIGRNHAHTFDTTQTNCSRKTFMGWAERNVTVCCNIVGIYINESDQNFSKLFMRYDGYDAHGNNLYVAEDILRVDYNYIPNGIQFHLTFHNLSLTDARQYMCAIGDSVNHVLWPSILTLNVGEYPRIVYASTDITVDKNTTAELVCSATGLPIPVIAWYKYPFKGSKKALGVIGAKLWIHKIEWWHAGHYECAAANTAPLVATKSIILHVNTAAQTVPPYISVVPGEDSSKSVLVACIIYAYPPPTWSWYYKDTPLLESGSEGVIHTDGNNWISYHLTEDGMGNKSALGIYRCSASNEGGEDSAEIRILNQEETDKQFGGMSVFMTQRPEDTVARQGSTVLLSCGFEDKGATPVHFSWWKEDPHTRELNEIFTRSANSSMYPEILSQNKYNVIMDEDDPLQHALKIVDVQPRDHGLYGCHVGGWNFTLILTVAETVSCANTEPAESNNLQADYYTCSLPVHGHKSGMIEATWTDRLTKMGISSIIQDTPENLIRILQIPTYETADSYFCSVQSRRSIDDGVNSCSPPTIPYEWKKGTSSLQVNCEEYYGMVVGAVLFVAIDVGLIVLIFFTIRYYKKQLPHCI